MPFTLEKDFRVQDEGHKKYFKKTRIKPPESYLHLFCLAYIT